MSSKKILIVGLGLIGGSYAKRLKNNGHHVGAITLNQEDIDYAIKNNNDIVKIDILSEGLPMALNVSIKNND